MFVRIHFVKKELLFDICNISRSHYFKMHCDGGECFNEFCAVALSQRFSTLALWHIGVSQIMLDVKR